MNKKEMILSEAKRLSGTFGYLGFTLKQLAQACDMTAPALYYFYTSKADLFKDCLLSELEIRHESLKSCTERATSLTEFANYLADEAIEKCGAHHFRTGQAMLEIIHLPEDIQAELREAWQRLLIQPVEELIEREMPGTAPLTRNMLATFFINMATFTGSHELDYGREALRAMMIAATTGLQTLTDVVATPVRETVEA